jgi:hypothetical protein
MFSVITLLKFSIQQMNSVGFLIQSRNIMFNSYSNSMNKNIELRYLSNIPNAQIRILCLSLKDKRCRVLQRLLMYLYVYLCRKDEGGRLVFAFHY